MTEPHDDRNWGFLIFDLIFFGVLFVLLGLAVGEILVDAGVIRMPVLDWPIFR
jgi:hypothetical protein